MKNWRTGLISLFLVFLLLSLVVPNQSSATILTYNYGSEFSGAYLPSGPAPWLTATFDDSYGDANTVRLTMSSAGLVPNETVKEWYFNFNPALDPTALSFNYVSGVSPDAISTGVDGFKADGDGLYDILFDFGKNFIDHETVVYDLVFNSEITASSFDFLSTFKGPHGPFLTAAHVQRINDEDCPVDDPDCASGWVTVPEMQTMYLLGIGLLGFFGLKRRFRENTSK